MKKDNELGIKKTELTLDRIEGDKAVFLNKEDEEIILDKKMLPKAAKEGDVLVLTIATNDAETKQREQSAKSILNEILNTR
jgi:flagellar basal body L-ring protein FlgH